MRSPAFHRLVLRAFAVVAVVSISPVAVAETPPSPKRLNILFLMDDQHRGDCLGARGATWLKTPNLDRLAGEGALFTRGYSSSPTCLPARAGILTGMRPWNHGLLSFLAIPNRYRVEMPRLLSEGGYRTHVCGKTHYYGASHGFQTREVEEFLKDFDDHGLYLDDYMRWMQINHPEKDPTGMAASFTDHRGNRPWPYREDTHPTHWTAERAKDFLRDYHGERPWFLKVSFHRPHPPFDPPKRLMDEYKAKELPEPKVGAWAEAKYGNARGSLERTPDSAIGHFPAQEIHDSRAAYYASIAYVDEKIGEVLKALEARGELENTLILFTSDHGDMMGDHHLWRKAWCYEGSANIPMIIRWPESMKVAAPRGSRFDHLVEMRDILPTFLDAAGVPIPEQVDGRSMLGILRDPACSWREILDLEHGSGYFSEIAYVALTDRRYKYIHYMQTGESQLFDLAEDPHELHEVTDDGLKAEWERKLVDFLAERGEEWVKDGQVVRQTKRMRYSPNFAKQMLEPAATATEQRFNPPVEPLPLAAYLKLLDGISPIALPGASALKPAPPRK